MGLFGTNEPNLHALIEVKTGKGIIVVTRADPAYKLWMMVLDTDYFKNTYDIDDVIYEDELQEYLEKLDVSCIYLPSGRNAAYSSETVVANFNYLSKFKVDKEIIYDILSQSRMHKTDAELEVLRIAYTYSVQAHKHIMQSVRPGVYENQIEAIFRFEAHSRLGSKFLTALPVVSSGKNLCNVYYYDNDAQIPDNSLVIADMGIKYLGYCADITNTFPINGKFSTLQRDIYTLLVEAVQYAKSILKPKSDVETLHGKILQVMMKGLVARGIIIKYDPSFDSLFIPHLTVIPSGLGETEAGYDSRAAEKIEETESKSNRYYIHVARTQKISSRDHICRSLF